MRNRRIYIIISLLLAAVLGFLPLIPVSAAPLEPSRKLFSPAAALTTQWTDMKESGGVAYFLYPGSPTTLLQRFDLTARTWLPDVSLNGNIPIFTVDTDGLYFSDLVNIYRSNLDGSAPTQIYQLSSGFHVDALHTDGAMLLVNYHNNNDDIILLLTLINKYSGLEIGAYVDIPYRTPFAISWTALARGRNLIVGREIRDSSSFIYGITYHDDGSFEDTFLEIRYCFTPGTSKIWWTPDESLIVDGCGFIYNPDNERAVATVEKGFQDLTFSPDSMVILKNNLMIAYSLPTMVETGRFALPVNFRNIIYSNGTIFAFSFVSGAATPLVEQVSPGDFKPLEPGDPVNPEKLAFLPDQIVQGRENTFFLLHKASKSIFLLDAVSQKYLLTIPLTDTPTDFTYAPSVNNLFVTYPDDRVTIVRLDESLTEHAMVKSPFHVYPTTIILDNFLLTAYPSNGVNGWTLYNLYTLNGEVHSYMSSDSWIGGRTLAWNSTLRRVYYCYGWHQLNMDGSLAARASFNEESVGCKAWQKEDGTILVFDQGRVVDGTTNTLIGSFPHGFTDMKWKGENLYTISAGNDGKTKVEHWGGTYLSLIESKEILGTPLRIFGLGDNLVVFTNLSENVQTTILDASLGVIQESPIIEKIDATVVSGSAPLEVQFSSEMTRGTADTYLWDFGDGQTGTQATPTHTFVVPGQYTVSLTVTNPGGTTTLQMDQLINVTPIEAKFTVSRQGGVAPLRVQFINQTKGGENNTYQWDFGDGTTSTEINPVHIYSKTGTYIVTLNVTGPSGEATTSLDHIWVNYQLFLPWVNTPHKLVTLPGTYDFGVCGTVALYYGTKVAVWVDECVTNVTIGDDGDMTFNVTWTARYNMYNTCLRKYSDQENHKMYVTNEKGDRFDFYEVGGAANQYIRCMEEGVAYSGWFLFHGPGDRFTNFTFHDANNKIHLGGLQIPTFPE